MLRLNPYIPRVVRVRAVQITDENIPELAELIGVPLGWHHTKKKPYILIPGTMGTIQAFPGMYAVRNEQGEWRGMKPAMFKNRFVIANDRGERVPPYTEGETNGS